MVGTDGVFIHIAENYYFSGIMPTVDTVTVRAIRKRVDTTKPLLVGWPFPALAVSDTPYQLIDLK